MARRLKENPMIHRTRIAEAAGSLFEQEGIEKTTMKEIADKAGYSKATLYVYFKNKEEIIAYLVLNSMITLKEIIERALTSKKDYFETYMDLCNGMVRYAQTYPLYFSMVLENINIDFEHSQFEEEERETFRVGEQINELLCAFFQMGKKQGVTKYSLDAKSLIFELWGMISGLINISFNKQQYIEQEIHISKEQFLERGFVLIYDAIKK